MGNNEDITSIASELNELVILQEVIYPSDLRNGLLISIPKT